MTTVDTSEAVQPDLPETEYHAHPALSSSGARKLLPPSCPAVFDYERRNPPPGKSVFDIGSAAHKLVLGAGMAIRVVDAKDWRTKAAQEQRDAAREAGEIPVLTHEYELVRGMADAIGLHPVAGQLFTEGTPELSIFWRDGRSGVDCRARLDWLTTNVLGEPVVVDYKTCASADPRAIARSVASYGYCVQERWYVEGAKAVGLADDPGFLFVFQEKTPPYLVSVIALDDNARRLGARLSRRARAIYAECVESDCWPGYSDQVEQVSLPAWAEEEAS